jgi:hypothetical protein
MAWAVHGGDSLRCDRHNEIFSKDPRGPTRGRCPKASEGCGADVEDVDLDADLDPPIVALVAEMDDEQKLVEKDLKSLRQRKVKAGWVYAAIGKLVDAKTKIWRARMESARIKRDEALVARREKRMLERKRKATH